MFVDDDDCGNEDIDDCGNEYDEDDENVDDFINIAGCVQFFNTSILFLQ
jgi:hypothetical protein